MVDIRINNDLNTNNTISGLTPLARKFVYIENQSQVQTIKNDSFKQNIKSGEIPSNIIVANKDKIEGTISTAKTVLNLTSGIVAVTGQKEHFDTFLRTSTGAITVTEGAIKLADAKESDNKVKTVVTSMSNVANGVATVLSVANIPEAEFISFTGKALGIGVEQQNLSENIEKKNSRGIAGSIVGLSRGAWALTLSGAKIAKLGASHMHKLGKVSSVTLQKVSTKSNNITKLADKIAIPFAVAGTALSYWDWQIARDKYKSKEVEKIEEIESGSNNQDKIEKLNKESKSLKTDALVRGLSFGVSAISTTALISSVAFPVTAPVTGPIAVASMAVSSILSVFSNQKSRDDISNLYKKSIKYHDKIVDSLDKIIFAPKYKTA